MSVSIATKQDIPSLVALINSAYRGNPSKAGWTTEADLLTGEIRTDENNIEQMMQSDGAVFLKFTGDKNNIEGSVFLQKKGTRMYLGMLSVSPLLQDKGIGKQLMNEAEEYTRKKDCDSIYMRVISLRHELISWYERKGYQKTGETESFPTDGRFGTPTQPLEFIIMEKKLI